MTATDPPCKANGVPSGAPQTVHKTVLICEYMNKLDFSPKDFMVTFFSSTVPEIDHRRRMAKAGLGIKASRSIVKNLGKLTRSCEEGKAGWEKIVLDEVSGRHI